MTAMATNYVLIDYENVHPKNLELLLEHPFKVYVFVGDNLAKIPFDLADSMQFPRRRVDHAICLGVHVRETPKRIRARI